MKRRLKIKLDYKKSVIILTLFSFSFIPTIVISQPVIKDSTLSMPLLNIHCLGMAGFGARLGVLVRLDKNVYGEASYGVSTLEYLIPTILLSAKVYGIGCSYIDNINKSGSLNYGVGLRSIVLESRTGNSTTYLFSPYFGFYATMTMDNPILTYMMRIGPWLEYNKRIKNTFINYSIIEIGAGLNIGRRYKQRIIVK